MKVTQNNQLLTDDDFKMFQPNLAWAFGINNAIFLQNLQNWLYFHKIQYEKDPQKYAHHMKDNQIWVYNTVQDWQKQLKFLSTSSIERAIRELKKDGILITNNYNKAKYDRTVWYRINYDKLGNDDYIMEKIMERDARKMNKSRKEF